MLAGLARIRKTAYPVGAPSIATDGPERCNENSSSSWKSRMRRDQDLSDWVEPMPLPQGAIFMTLRAFRAAAQPCRTMALKPTPLMEL